MVFHEITKAAILEAVSNPRSIDDDLVAAQETRRILDRLYGYEVSPVLWKKVMPKLSAGRVQSVATRVIVERERARMRFTNADYWDIKATLSGTSDTTSFVANLVSIAGRRLATGKDFDADTGQLKTDVVQLELYDAAGAFTGGVVRVGSFPVDTGDAPCGVCLRALGNKGEATETEYVATAGVVNITAVGIDGQPISATITGATFAELGVEAKAPNVPCTATLAAIKIEGTVMEVGGSGGGAGGGAGQCVTTIGD